MSRKIGELEIGDVLATRSNGKLWRVDEFHEVVPGVVSVMLRDYNDKADYRLRKVATDVFKNFRWPVKEDYNRACNQKDGIQA